MQFDNPCTQQVLKRINLQINDHNTKKRDRFNATIAHAIQKKYINLFLRAKETVTYKKKLAIYKYM